MDQMLKLEITDLAFGGDGVGHADGMVVFVRGGIPGDIIQIEMEQKKKRFARGRLVEIVESSGFRQESGCALSSICPGCAYQHVEYSQEVLWKQVQLESLLRRIGGFSELPSSVPQGSPRALHYRNKVVLHADGSGALGYIGADNRTVLDVRDCPLAVEDIGKALQDYRAVQAAGLQARDKVTFRWTPTDGVVFWQNRDVPDVFLTEEVLGKQWQIPADVFWQTNPYAIDLLATAVQAFVDVCHPKCLIDLYCGSGLFSLLLADRVEHVLGVEMQGRAVGAAEKNGVLHGCKNVTFLGGDAGRKLPAALAHVKGAETLVVVDPPRSGLARDVCTGLLREGRQPRNILYVSCAADTLARDLKVLGTGGYAIRDLQLVDMFPRTAHFETVVLLERA